MSDRPPKKKVKRATQLQMLQNNTPFADMIRTKRYVSSSEEGEKNTTTSRSNTPQSELRPKRLVGNDDEEDAEDDDASSSSIASDDDDSSDKEEQDEEEEDEEDDNGNEAPLYDPVTGKRKTTYKPAMTPDNILVPWAELCASYKKFPCPGCYKKNTLEAKAYTKGCITDIVLTCTRDGCNRRMVIQTTNRKTPVSPAFDDPTKTKFSDYTINYCLVLMMQLLGIGPDGLSIIFAFLGIACNKGGYQKWKHLQDNVGTAEQVVCKEVMEANMQDEIDCMKAKAKEQFNCWFFNEGGNTATEQEKVAKMQELLKVKDGRVGITTQMDHAWQKQKIGMNGGNSLSGHNACIGSHTLKVCNLVVYSKLCRTCKTHRKKNLPIPPHRCSQNYSPNLSSKAMEAKASVQHKVEIDTGDTAGAYIHTLLTDDDSQTRANLLHSYKAIADRDYPGWNEEGGCGKRGTDWPYEWRTTKKGKRYKAYYLDHGKVPLDIPQVQVFKSDIGHRVKCIASMVFSNKYKSKKPEEKGEIGLHKWECLKLKKIAGYYFKGQDNQELPLEEFKRRSHCIYLHHFNDHSCCDERWCKVLKSNRRHNPLQLTAAYLSKFRSKERDSEIFQKLKKGYEPYLTDAALEQVYHKFSTNKNESFNRRVSAVAPKNRHFSSTMTLYDRVCNVVISDSVGYLQGLQSILSKCNIELELHPVLKEWCSRKDKRMQKEAVYRKQPEVKKKRSEAINAEIRAGSLRDAKAKSDGMDYGSGIALEIAVDTKEDEEDDEAATNSLVEAALSVAATSTTAATTTTSGSKCEDHQKAVI